MTEATKYGGRPHPASDSPDTAVAKGGAPAAGQSPRGTGQRAMLATADLSAFVKTKGGGSGGFAADYIPHGILRALLIRAGLDYDWDVVVEKVGNEWRASGTIVIRWDDGTVQTMTETSDLDGGPADASSRCFARAVAFATGLGLDLWAEGKASKLARTDVDVHDLMGAR